MTNEKLDLKWAAASEFIRDVIEAVGLPQPAPECVVDLNKLALTVVGCIEELKEEAEILHANCLVEDQLRTSAEAALSIAMARIAQLEKST